MKYGIMAACLSLGVAGASSAVFTNCSVTPTLISVGGLNLCRAELFANFNGPTDTILNVFNFQAQGGWSSNPAAASGFWHKDNSDYNGGVLSQQYGTWAPQLTGSATLNRPFDSWLTIGGTATATNTSNADPSWPAAGGGWNRADLPQVNEIGWFNSSPPNNQGRVGVGGNSATSVKLGQFILSANDTTIRTYSLRIAYNNGAGGGVQFVDSTFTLCIPTPGAIALLGLAGLTQRRRR
ncbi:MAG: hypothetical protein LW690_16040 [Opitutaceae bacterium]|nr:hypothetical protein [Opitutaceae bacterium]